MVLKADHLSCAQKGDAERRFIKSSHVALGQGSLRMSYGGPFLHQCDGRQWDTLESREMRRFSTVS